MRILFLTNLLPYPLDNGGKINTYTKVAALKKGGHTVDLVSFKETQNDVSEYEEHMRQYCEGVYQIYLRLTTAENKLYMARMALQSLASCYSFGVYKYKSKGMKQLLRELSSKHEYGCIYYDHLQMYIYEPFIKKLWPQAKEIIDEHNCETVIMQRNADVSVNPIKKVFLMVEARKLKRFENESIRKADETIVLSEADKIALEKQMGGPFPSIIIPNRVAETSKIKKTNEQASDKLRIMFVGTMTWEPNNSGILWFMDNVYRKILESNQKVELYIVGKNPSSQVIELAKTLQNVTVTGYVDSVDPYYEMCDLMVVPLFVGSGQRIKIIEAFSRKMPVVSTTIGAEGLVYQDGQSIFIANQPEEFVNAIEKCKEFEIRRTMADNARKNYDLHYSTEAIGQRFNQVFTEL